MMKKLQKLGSALMLPVAVLPIAGILMGLGYVLCPAFMMGAEWAASLGHATSGVAHTIGWLMITAGNALIGAMAELFVLGVSIGLAKDNNGTAAIAGFVSYLMIKTLVNVDIVKMVFPFMVENANNVAAYGKVAGNTFIGILAGVIGGVCYNKFKDTKLPDFLSFCDRDRCHLHCCCCHPDLRVAHRVLRVGGSGHRYLQAGCCGRWYLRVPEPFADPLRPASRSEQRVLV